MKLPALKEIIDERKEKAVENLSEHYAKNKIPLEEYERLVEYIHKTESERELVIIERFVADFGSVSGAPEEPDYDEDEPDYPQNNRHQNSNLANLCILSTRSFSGQIQSGSQFVSILGSSEIRVRKADLKKRRTEINVLVILGSCDIIVESGIRVSNKAIPILGNAGISQKLKKQDGDMELLITGTALLGDISVKLLKE